MSASKPPAPKEDPFDKHILVLDDDEAIRHMLQATLEAEGFRVKTGREGRTVMTMVQNFRPHLIISDMMMPNGGGLEMLRILQGDTDARHIPVMLISGHGFDGSTKDMFKQEPNVVAFFEKPIRPVQFMMKVHELLNTMSREQKMMEERQKFGDIEKKFEDLM